MEEADKGQLMTTTGVSGWMGDFTFWISPWL